MIEKRMLLSDLALQDGCFLEYYALALRTICVCACMQITVSSKNRLRQACNLLLSLYYVAKE